MVNCYKHVIESIEVVCQLVGELSDSSFQLNERQCQILAKELVETKAFLEKRNACSKSSEGVEYITLQHLCSAVKRGEVLVKKCCCKDLESWLVSAMILVEIQEEFMAIILNIHMWRMLLDFAIICGRGLSREKKAEEMKIMDEECHQLFKDLRRESHALWQAAMEDKGTIISRTSRIAELCGSTNNLNYLQAIYLQSWLSGSATCRDMDLNKCEYINVLGQGGCGIVMKVKWLGVECALKMLGGQDEKEATTLKGLFHPNIIRLLYYWEDCPENPQSRLLMELMPQDLGAYMRGLLKNISSSKMQMGKDSMPFSLPVAIDIMYQIAQAMRYMHDKHLTHRDLKPANILVKERPRVGLTCIDGAGYLDIKLADFGLVKSYTNTSTFQAHSKGHGTTMYRAPEIIGKDMAQKRHYLPMADVWSFGITCAEILSGKQAYAEYVDDYGLAIYAMISKEGLRPTLPKHCPPYLAFCIKSCWEYLPSRRPTFASLCKLLRHAKLLSLGVTKLDDSKFFFAYSTRSDQVQSLHLSPSSSKARVSTFFQSSLKFMGIGPRRFPSAIEVLPAAALMHKVRLVPTPLIVEDSPEHDEDIGGGIATPRSLIEGEYHHSAVLPITNILQKEQVVSLPMVTKESQLIDEDIVGGIATLANTTHVIKSFLDLQEPVQLTQANLDNAIPPSNASDEIQLAIVPRKTLNRKMLKTEVVGPLKNRHKNHSRQIKNKLDHLLSQVQDSSKGKSVEPELPKFHKVASASITLPKLSRYPFDGTKPSSKKLMMAVVRVKTAVIDFVEDLIMDMNEYPVEFQYLRQTIFQEIKVEWARVDHLKFLVQAFICKQLFDGFDHQNGYFGIEYFENDQMTKLVSFNDFSKFKDEASTISMLLDSNSLDDSFLGRFCFKKFKSIFGQLHNNQPLSIYQEERDAVERECHPNTMFYKRFLKVVVLVWLVHRLVHSFEEKVEMLIYDKGAKFQRQTMESVVPRRYKEEDEGADVNTKVNFSVIPGFQMNRSVVKCEVYIEWSTLSNDFEITRRTSSKKTPMKTPSNDHLGKTLSAKTFGTLHIPELPIRDNNPRSLRPFEFGTLHIPELPVRNNNPRSLRPFEFGTLHIPELPVRDNNPRSLRPFEFGTLHIPELPVRDNNPRSLRPFEFGTLHIPELPVRDNNPRSLRPFEFGTLHIPELPVRDNNPRSLWPFEGLNSSSHYVDHYPSTTVGDVRSRGLALMEAIREHRMFWEGSDSESDKEDKFEQDNSSEKFSASHGDGTTAFKMPVPTARSSNPRDPHYVSRDSKLSEMRRLSNTRRSFPDKEAIREKSMFGDAQQEGLIPGNQGSVNRSGRKNKYNQDNFPEKFSVSHGHGTTVYKMPAYELPAPTARSSKPRGPHHVSRDSKVSERRRLSNTRPRFPEYERKSSCIQKFLYDFPHLLFLNRMPDRN